MEKTMFYIRISELIGLELTEGLNEEQKKELENWLQSGSGNKVLYEKIRKKEEILKTIEKSKKINKEKAWEKINYEIFGNKKTIKKSNYRFYKYDLDKF